MSQLAVVLVNWNQAEATRAYVESLPRWDRLRPEIGVVDDGSAAEEVARLANLCERARDHGYAAAVLATVDGLRGRLGDANARILA